MDTTLLFLSTLSCRWVWIATVVTVQNLTGGPMAFFMVSTSFVADNSLPRDRIIRLGALHFCFVARSGGPFGVHTYIIKPDHEAF